MMSRDALWENYNARGLSPEMVAESFVPPRQFVDVAKARNSVLLGPRGSGKTTLLRMLDPRALGTWRQREGVAAHDGIDYIGIFVPVDKAWISSLDNALRPLPVEHRSGAELAVYALAIARSLVDTMVWRMTDACSIHAPLFAINMDASTEASLATHLGNLWLPGHRVVSLLQLRLLLSQQLTILPRELLNWSDSQRQDYLLSLASPIKLASAACDAFNLLAKDEDRRWVILCDELEIAPDDVRIHLFASLRATPQPILLKLALTPAMKMNNMAGSEHPVPAHDYDSISLSYGTREEGINERSREDFCRGIWKGLVESRGEEGGVSVDADLAFETPNVSPARSATSGKRGGTDARIGSLYRYLADIDESFARYLVAKGVDVQDLDASPPKLLDSVIRKVRPIVEVRAYYLKKASGARVGRASRKAAVPYCGAKSIFAISESHPRWLKSTLGAMLEDATSRSSTISIVAQSREIKAAVSRIVARLRSFPAADGQSTYALVDKIGLFFAAQIYAQKFKADPALSFIVDVDDGRLLRCLENALYIGALVPLDIQSHAYLLKGIQGGRFRLSNWLAPHFKLPLVAGKAVKLSSILERSAAPGLLDETAQLSLGLEL